MSPDAAPAAPVDRQTSNVAPSSGPTTRNVVWSAAAPWTSRSGGPSRGEHGDPVVARAACRRRWARRARASGSPRVADVRLALLVAGAVARGDGGEPVALVEPARAHVDLEAVEIEAVGRGAPWPRRSAALPTPRPIHVGRDVQLLDHRRRTGPSPRRPGRPDRSATQVSCAGTSSSASQRRTSSSGWPGGKSNVARQAPSQTSPMAGPSRSGAPDQQLVGGRHGRLPRPAVTVRGAPRPPRRGSRSRPVARASWAGQRRGSRARPEDVGEDVGLARAGRDHEHVVGRRRGSPG